MNIREFLLKEAERFGLRGAESFHGDVDLRPASGNLRGADVLQFQDLARQVVIAEDIARYTVRLVSASLPGSTWKNGFFSIGSTCAAHTRE